MMIAARRRGVIVVGHVVVLVVDWSDVVMFLVGVIEGRFVVVACGDRSVSTRRKTTGRYMKESW